MYVSITSSIIILSYSVQEPPKTDLAIAVKTKQQLVIPKVALNGKIISSVKRKSGTALDHVVIDMNEEFVTARTSRDQLSSHYLSMNELMRVVRIEEGLNVTPRDLHHLRQQPSTSKPISVDFYNINTTPALRQKPLALDVRQLACKERATRAVFNADGDITARMTNASSPRTGCATIGLQRTSNESCFQCGWRHYCKDDERF
ncbi:hypothetical protein NECAME_16729 [Necator americanus]|uniref:Uncharacterized protein n=1 Tax=Necator americanus TaxID=51031 RepID=W2TVB5_NECAM|nr:hypothetical protein NECAME_16729 [Necator americanus]ETN85594.1 hypothetical protein NECAME_16729 [Necator americanus]